MRWRPIYGPIKLELPAQQMGALLMSDVMADRFTTVPAMALVGFLFINLEMMAMEIEQPFGDDADDLPLEQYCLGIETVCLDFLKRSPYK